MEKLSNLLTDGDGFRLAFGWRGGASLKPCFKHDNVLKKDCRPPFPPQSIESDIRVDVKDSDLAHRRPGYVEIDCSDHHMFRETTAAEVWAKCDALKAGAARVASGEWSRARFGLLEKSFGLNFNPHGLLSNEALRGFVDPVRTMTWAWAHSFLQDGAFTTEVTLLLKACEPLGVTFATLRDFLKDDRWRFPKATKAKSAGLYRVFDAWRSSSGDANQAMPRKYVSAERLRLGFHERCAFCFPKEGLLAMFRQRQGTGGSSGCTS